MTSVMGAMTSPSLVSVSYLRTSPMSWSSLLAATTRSPAPSSSPISWFETGTSTDLFVASDSGGRADLTAGESQGNGSGTTSPSTQQPHLPCAVQIVIAVFVCCVILLTVMGNILVVVSFCRFKRLRNYTQYFILSLAVADVLVGCVDMPLYGLVFILGYWPFGEIFCDIFVFCDHAFSHFSVASAVVIGVDRFVALTKPFFYRRTWRTKRNAAILISLSYTVPVLIWLPVTVLWPIFNGGVRNVQTATCQPQYVESLAASIIAPVIFFWVPVLVVTGLYCRVHRGISKTLRNRQKMTNAHPLSGPKLASRGDELSCTEKPLSTIEGEASAKTDARPEPSPHQTNGIESDDPMNSQHTTKLGSDTALGGSYAVGMENDGFSSGDGDGDSGQDDAEDSTHHDKLTTPVTGKTCTRTFLEIDPGNLPQLPPADAPFGTPHTINARDDSPTDRQGQAHRYSPGPRARVAVKRARTESTRATKLFGCIVAAMITTWLPWAIIVMVINICGDCLPETLYAVSVFLGYMNSTLNPYCYAVADRRFRRAFKEILRHPCGTSSPLDPYNSSKTQDESQLHSQFNREAE